MDRFGEKVKTEIADEESFYVYVDISISPTFYSGVFKFAGEIQILELEMAVEEISTTVVFELNEEYQTN